MVMLKDFIKRGFTWRLHCSLIHVRIVLKNFICWYIIFFVSVCKMIMVELILILQHAMIMEMLVSCFSLFSWENMFSDWYSILMLIHDMDNCSGHTFLWRDDWIVKGYYISRKTWTKCLKNWIILIWFR